MPPAPDTLDLVPALLSAADAHVTGRLSTALPDGDPAQVYVSEGHVYGVVAHDGSPTLGERLVASGVLSCADLEMALEAQRTDVPGWRIGELLVHLGFVEPEQVQACLQEQMREMLAWLLTQPSTGWHLRQGARTRAAFAEPIEVTALLAALGVALDPELEPAADPSQATVVNLDDGDVRTMDRSDAMAELRDLNDDAPDEEGAGTDGRRRGLSLWRSSESLPRQRQGKAKDRPTRRGQRTR